MKVPARSVGAVLGLRANAAQFGLLVAVNAAVWGLGQLATGALSDRWGRKHLITGDMLLQTAALVIIATANKSSSTRQAAVPLQNARYDTTLGG